VVRAIAVAAVVPPPRNERATGARCGLHPSRRRQRAPILSASSQRAAKCPILNMDSDKPTNLPQHVANDVGTASGPKELIRDVKDDGRDGCCTESLHEHGPLVR
jgi:hypothetical protein